MRNRNKIIKAVAVTVENIGQEVPISNQHPAISNLTGYDIDGHEVSFRILAFSANGKSICQMCLN